MLGNKASMMDLPVILAMLFILAVSIFISVQVLGEFDEAWDYGGTGQEIINEGKQAMYVFDYMFVFLAVGLSVTTLIAAFMVNSHPVFYFFSTVLLGIITVVAAQITNAFDKFATTSAFGGIANDFPMLLTFIRNFPLFILVSGILIAVVMYGRPATGGHV